MKDGQFEGGRVLHPGPPLQSSFGLRAASPPVVVYNCRVALRGEAPTFCVPSSFWVQAIVVRILLCCWLAVATSSGIPLWADTFVLHSGGQVRGTWLNRDAPETANYLVETDFGGRLELRRQQVKQRIAPQQTAYEDLRRAAADTVSDHERLAAWCRDHDLEQLRQQHLRRILELDPHHAEARRLLGYRLVADKWMTREEQMNAQGYRLFEGRYRTEQEIRILEEKREQEVVRIQWRRDIKKWREWLQGPKRETAEQHFRSIDDQAAIPTLEHFLYQQREPLRHRLLYLEALAAIQSPAARALLVNVSLSDENQEVRFSARELATRNGAHDVLIGYVAALANKDNVVVNRAAMGLAELGNPEAVPSLIDAVVTKHKQIIHSNQGGTTATFGSNGSTGLGLGGGPRVKIHQVSNPEVLRALNQLTNGVSHGYDQQSWKQWHALQRGRASFNARRD